MRGKSGRSCSLRSHNGNSMGTLPNMPRSTKRESSTQLALAALGFMWTTAAGHLPLLKDLSAHVHVLGPGGNSLCGDGSEFVFLVRPGTVNKVMVDFMGGGACWNAQTCEHAAVHGLLRINSLMRQLNGLPQEVASLAMVSSGVVLPTDGGTFAGAGVEDWTYVLVPYCTQDVHMGKGPTEYGTASGQSLRVFHTGAANVAAVMAWLWDSMPEPETIAFIGCSAGATVVNVVQAASAVRRIKQEGLQSRVLALGDSPAMVVHDSFVQAAVANWGLETTVEDVFGNSVSLPQNADLVPKLWQELLRAMPNLTAGYHVAVRDQLLYTTWRDMSGSEVGSMTGWQRRLLSITKQLNSLPNFRSFVAGSAGHCFMSFDQARWNSDFSVWAGALMRHLPLASVDCGEHCRLSGLVGCDNIRGSELVEDQCGVCGGDGQSCSAGIVGSASAPATAVTSVGEKEQCD